MTATTEEAKPIILWPTDTSTDVSAALPAVRDLMFRRGADLHLLLIAEDPTKAERYWGSGLDVNHEVGLRLKTQNITQKRLESICNCELEGCENMSVHCAVGDAKEQILLAAAELNPMLVVVARPTSEGDNSFGATMARVVSGAELPLITVDVPSRQREATCPEA